MGNTYKGELYDPNQEEAKQLLGRNMGRFRQQVGPGFPPMSKDAAKADGQQVATIESVDAEPNDTYDGANGDEKVSSIHAVGGTGNDRAT